MRLAKLLKLHRAAMGMDQKALAVEIGIAPTTLSRLESGKGILMPEFLKVLVWLCGDEGESG